MRPERLNVIAAVRRRATGPAHLSAERDSRPNLYIERTFTISYSRPGCLHTVRGETKLCPVCDTEIDADAKRCPSCQTDLSLFDIASDDTDVGSGKVRIPSNTNLDDLLASIPEG